MENNYYKKYIKYKNKYIELKQQFGGGGSDAVEGATTYYYVQGDKYNEWLKIEKWQKNMMDFPNLDVPTNNYDPNLLSHSIVKNNNNFIYYYYGNKKTLLNLNTGKEKQIKKFYLDNHKGYVNNPRINKDDLNKINTLLKNTFFDNFLQKSLFKKINTEETEQVNYRLNGYIKYFVQCQNENEWRESEPWETSFFNIAWKNHNYHYEGNDEYDRKYHISTRYLSKELVKSIGEFDSKNDYNNSVFTICQNDNNKYVCYFLKTDNYYFLNTDNYYFHIINLSDGGSYKKVFGKLFDFGGPQTVSSLGIKIKIKIILENLIMNPITDIYKTIDYKLELNTLKAQIESDDLKPKETETETDTKLYMF